MTDVAWTSRARRAAGRGRRIVPALAALALAGLLSACAPHIDAIGPPESPCFRSLAAASRAVQGHGKFSGVRFLTVAALTKDLRTSKTDKVSVPPELTSYRARAAQSKVCVVAYRDRYLRSRLESSVWPRRARRGRLVVVVVRERDQQILVSFLLDRAPIGFARVFPALGGTPALR